MRVNVVGCEEEERAAADTMTFGLKLGPFSLR
jgi:hypothetical protein